MEKTCESLRDVKKKREVAMVVRGSSVLIDQASMDFREGCRKKVMEQCEGDGITESPVFIGFSGLLRKVILSNEKGGVSLSD